MFTARALSAAFRLARITSSQMSPAARVLSPNIINFAAAKRFKYQDGGRGGGRKGGGNNQGPRRTNDDVDDCENDFGDAVDSSGEAEKHNLLDDK